MKVEKILYQKIFPTGVAYLNHKIGVEIDVEEGDDYDECFRGAKALVEQWNIESNPSYSLTMEYMKPSEITSGVNGSQPTITKVDSKESAIESHIKTINECKTLNNLKIFEKLVKNTNDDSLSNAYTTKHQELFMKNKTD